MHTRPDLRLSGAHRPGWLSRALLGVGALATVVVAGMLGVILFFIALGLVALTAATLAGRLAWLRWRGRARAAPAATPARGRVLEGEYEALGRRPGEHSSD